MLYNLHCSSTSLLKVVKVEGNGDRHIPVSHADDADDIYARLRHCIKPELSWNSGGKANANANAVFLRDGLCVFSAFCGLLFGIERAKVVACGLLLLGGCD